MLHPLRGGLCRCVVSSQLAEALCARAEFGGERVHLDRLGGFQQDSLMHRCDVATLLIIRCLPWKAERSYMFPRGEHVNIQEVSEICVCRTSSPSAWNIGALSKCKCVGLPSQHWSLGSLSVFFHPFKWALKGSFRLRFWVVRVQSTYGRPLKIMLQMTPLDLFPSDLPIPPPCGWCGQADRSRAVCM
jgi:hypothetical protein